MKIDWLAVLDLGLAFGTIMVFLIWELLSLRRAQRRDREAERQRDQQR